MRADHILVVDDNPDARESLAEVLEIEGYAVRTAENGRVALDMIVEQRPALILLDLMMPVMDGWQVVDAIQADVALATVPIVILSASTSPPPAGLPFLVKPAGVDELLHVVRDGLSSAPGSA